MARRKRQKASVFFFWPLYYLSFCLFLLAIVLSVLLCFSSGDCIICPSVFFFWRLYYLSFCLFLGQKKKTEGQIIQRPEEKDRRTDNTMARRKRQKDR
jgi:hypothetical protein